MSPRSNQKARTRAALLAAAIDLVREGRPPSMAEAAERAMVSVATAYRYFPSADDLWFEAAESAADMQPMLDASQAAVDAAGTDPLRRLEVLTRTSSFYMLENQAPFRRLARAALDQWFSQRETPEADATPVREGRRNALIAQVLEPLAGDLPPEQLERLAHALGAVVGTDVMIALTDGVGLDVDTAKVAMLDACRWMLTGALAELAPER